MKRSKGKMSSRTRNLGMAVRRLTPAQMVRKYKVGELVVLDLQSRFEGMPHPRYRGRVGTITGLRGAAYEVTIQDGRMKKMLISTGVHLQRKG